MDVGVDNISSSNVLESGSASMTISLPSGEETSKRNFEEAGSSGSDTSGLTVSTDLAESRPEVNEKLKQRKLQRKDQIPQDRFDEWEEAYRVKAEQQKIDEIGKIIARGCNLVEELRDSTAHAEMICIREASNMLQTWRLSIMRTM
ncbi:unnamed protein product [Fraxinus pennsylvanica]|uniref:CMP/dCMP-type deaminase domain-containing protein n=1 Tax=Fraxinus pennsylvanica TaxID=56036 RepID=A0AAD1ZST1_9LAMI|nr:unnamed protein product [Fraxinus pennsylvanica]